MNNTNKSLIEAKTILLVDNEEFARNALRSEFERTLKPAGMKVKPETFSDIWPYYGDTEYWFFDWVSCKTHIQEIIEMLFDSSKCSNEVLVSTLFILGKVERKDPALKISPFTVSSLLMTAVLIAQKAAGKGIKENQFEVFANNLEWCTKLRFHKEMEFCLLTIINMEVGVNYPDYRLVKLMAVRKALKEGHDDENVPQIDSGLLTLVAAKK